MQNITRLTFRVFSAGTKFNTHHCYRNKITNKVSHLTESTANSNLLLNTNFNGQILINRKLASCKMPSALVLLATGAEETECVAVVNVLRRGEVKVVLAGVCGKEPVVCRSETVICPDMSLTDAICKGPFDVVVLPGGLGGSKILAESAVVGKLLKEQEKNCRLIAAICAAPTALKAHGIGCGKQVTSYPAMAEEMKKGDMYKYIDNCPVVQDGKLITSRGPATALIFGLKILAQLQGEDNAKNVAKAMLYTYN